MVGVNTPDVTTSDPLPHAECQSAAFGGATVAHSGKPRADPEAIVLKHYGYTTRFADLVAIEQAIQSTPVMLPVSTVARWVFGPDVTPEGPDTTLVKRYAERVHRVVHPVSRRRVTIAAAAVEPYADARTVAAQWTAAHPRSRLLFPDSGDPVLVERDPTPWIEHRWRYAARVLADALDTPRDPERRRYAAAEARAALDTTSRGNAQRPHTTDTAPETPGGKTLEGELGTEDTGGTGLARTAARNTLGATTRCDPADTASYVHDFAAYRRGVANTDPAKIHADKTHDYPAAAQRRDDLADVFADAGRVYDCESTMCTLTWDSDRESSALDATEDCYHDVDLHRKYVARHLPGHDRARPTLVVVEPQQNGLIHVHVVWFGVERWRFPDEEAITAHWRRRGCGHSLSVDRVYDIDGLAAYLTKSLRAICTGAYLEADDLHGCAEEYAECDADAVKDCDVSRDADQARVAAWYWAAGVSPYRVSATLRDALAADVCAVADRCWSSLGVSAVPPQSAAHAVLRAGAALRGKPPPVPRGVHGDTPTSWIPITGNERRRMNGQANRTQS